MSSKIRRRFFTNPEMEFYESVTQGVSGRLAPMPYGGNGELEDIQESLGYVKAYLGKLTQHLIERRMLTEDEVNELLP